MSDLLIALFILLLPLTAHAQCGTSSEQIASGDKVSVNVCAYIDNLAVIDEEYCLDNPDAENCNMVVLTEPVLHPCEINPDQLGCQYYQIEPASGE